MFFSFHLFSLMFILSQSSEICPFEACDASYIGDLWCDLDCNNALCNFDSSANSAELSKFEKFQLSDCFIDCLMSDCTEEMLKNEICDPKCNNEYCGFDLGTCGICASGCTKEKLQDSSCSPECNTDLCQYDNWYCGYCSKSCTKEDFKKQTCVDGCKVEDCPYIPNNGCFKQCSPNCPFGWLGDGICQEECNTKDCDYDNGDCVCSPGCNSDELAKDCLDEKDPCNNEDCDYKNGKCGYCAFKCTEEMLGDGVCNSECMNEDCEFDYQDCECTEGCFMYMEPSGTWKSIKENENSTLCLVPECNYNMHNKPDPFKVRQMILANMLHKNFSLQNVTELPTGCTLEDLKNFDNVSNPECPTTHPCYNEKGLWCMGRSKVSSFDLTGCLRFSNQSCLIYDNLMVDHESKPTLLVCPIGYSKRSDLSALFADSTHNIALCLPEISTYSEKTPNTFYVKATNPPVVGGTGTLADPFTSLYQAFYQVYSDFSKIILGGGNFVLEYAQVNSVYERSDPFDPLNFESQSQVILLSIEGDPVTPSVISWKPTINDNSIKIIKISSNAMIMHFKNIEFNGSGVLKDDCKLEGSFCLYCPSLTTLYTIQNSWTTVDDRRQKVSIEMQRQTKKCLQFSDVEIFVFSQESILENVVFRDFRMKFKTLIRSYSSLNLTNVSFISIVPKSGGNVLEVACESECKKVDFFYNIGNITDINPGYEITDSVDLGSFLKVKRIRSVVLSRLESTFNLLYSNSESTYPSYFLNLIDFNGTFSLSGSNFSNIYANSLFDIDVIKLKYDSLAADGYGFSEAYNQQHFSMIDVKFESIYTSDNFLSYAMKSVTHNINMKNVEFNRVYSGSTSIINLDYAGTLKKKDKLGDKVKLGTESAIIKRRQVNFSDITFKNSKTGGFLMNIVQNANVFISNLTAFELSDGDFKFAGQVVENFKSQKKYLSILPVSELIEDLSCQGAIRLLGCYNISLENVSLVNSFCQAKESPSGLVVANTQAYLNISALSLFNVSASSSDGAGLHFFNLNHPVKLENVSLSSVSNNDGSCIEMSYCSSISIKNLNIDKADSTNSAPFKVFEFKNFDLSVFTVSNSSSKYGDGGLLSLMATSKQSSYINIKSGTISDCYAYGNGGFLYLDATNIKYQQSLTISDLKLDTLFAEDGVFLYITKKINFFQTKVSNVEISFSAGNKALVFDSHLSGLLEMENLFIQQNQDFETSGILGEYQSESLLLKVTNLTLKDCKYSEKAFMFTGKNNRSRVEFEKVRISNISNFESFADGFRLFSISMMLKDLSLSYLNSFLLINNYAQAIVTSAGIMKTFGYVAQIFNKGFFNCSSCSISNNHGTIITASTGGSVNLTGSSITDNRYENSQVFILSIDSAGDSKNIIQNTVIQNNYAEKIDLIKFMNTEVQISNSKFQGNKVDSVLYTGIFIFKSNITISKTEFINQTSQSYGSFIYAIGKSWISISESKFKSGFSGMNGGALYLFECVSALIENCEFTNNSAFQNGGSIYSSNTPVTIKNSQFTSSRARSGVDAYLFDGSFEITKSTIEKSQCFAQSNCESVFAVGTSLTVSDVIIANTSFPVSGLYTSGFSDISISGSSFVKLQGTEFGALRLDGQSRAGSKQVKNVYISNCLFQENYSGSNGGAVNLNDMALLVQNSSFIKNFAQSAGGALYLVTPGCADCSFSIAGASQMVYNSAGKIGGAIKWDDYKPSIGEEVIVSNNTALYGPNFASTAAKLEMISSKRLLQDTHQNYSASINQIPPGQAYNDSFEVRILDTYNNTMLIDNSSILILEAVNLSLILQGNWSFQALNGTFNISNFIPRAVPGSNQTIRMRTDGIVPRKVPNDETVYKNDLLIQISMRPCSNGEKIGETSCTVCNPDRYLIKPAWNCKICPTGGNCTGGDKIWVKKGYYRSHHLSEIVYRCPLPDACLGNKYGWVTECLDGYTGITCAVCQSGYTKASSGKCNKCPEPFTNYVIMVGILVAVVAICVILVKSSIKSAFLPKAKHSIYIKIFTNYLQLVFLTTQFNLAWPSYVITLFGIQKSAATATDSLFSIDCYFKGQSEINNSDLYYFKMIFYAVLPLAIFIISILVWVGICMTRENFRPMKRELPLTMIVIFFLVYPNIVKFMFSNFACTNFDMLGKFLNDNYSVKCWTKEHSKYSLYVSLPSIILWSIGVPTLVLIAMIKRRNLLYKEDNRVVFGFIFNGYKTSIFFWEFIIMYRKILIICVIVFIAEVSTAVQGLTVALVLIFSLFIQYEVAPYNSDELNHMEIEALITATLTIYCGLYYLTQDIGEIFKIVLFIIIVCGNSYFIILWIFWMLKAIVDMLAKAIPSLKFALKKGDAFEDDFNKEELVINGSYFDVSDGKRHYTFLKSSQIAENIFNVTCVPELYARALIQNEEFNENHEEGQGDFEINSKEDFTENKSLALHDEDANLNQSKHPTYKSENFTPKFNEEKKLSDSQRFYDKMKVSDSKVFNDERKASNGKNSGDNKKVSYNQGFTEREEPNHEDHSFRVIQTERKKTKDRPMIAFKDDDFSGSLMEKSFANESSSLLENLPVFITEDDQVGSYIPSKIISPELVGDTDSI